MLKCDYKMCVELLQKCTPCLKILTVESAKRDHEGIQGGGAWLWRGGEVSPDSAVCVWTLYGKI